MNIGVPKESWPGETRVALVPDGVRRLAKRGAQVQIECGLGTTIGATDSDYVTAGASGATDRRALLASADMVLRVRPPPPEEVEWLKPGAVHISFLDPRNEPELLCRLAERGVDAISMERMPRITRAQSMDALSSQSSLAGYVAVILAATHLPRIFPMMMTAAGTLAAARVLVVGAGVAGLQAIATAHRLGARVEACDSRLAVEGEVRSLGARFLNLDISETGQSQEGYAEPLTAEQLMRQRQALKRICAQADVVITAAQVFGRRAPILLTAEVLDAMRPGSVVVDLAVESGGNVEGLTSSEVRERHGVKIIAANNLPSRVPVHASQTYSANLTALVEEFWDADSRSFCVKADDEILHACLVTHAGRVCHERPVGSPPG
jgi:NAD(P) transhydrogenase subunit alpha